jgi:hypothetical protein
MFPQLSMAAITTVEIGRKHGADNDRGKLGKPFIFAEQEDLGIEARFQAESSPHHPSAPTQLTWRHLPTMNLALYRRIPTATLTTPLPLFHRRDGSKPPNLELFAPSNDEPGTLSWSRPVNLPAVRSSTLPFQPSSWDRSESPTTPPMMNLALYRRIPTATLTPLPLFHRRDGSKPPKLELLRAVE